MIPAIETTILQGIVHDEKFTRKVLPYVREEYFESEEAKLVYNLAKDHFVKYGSCPNESTLSVAVDSVPNIHEDVHKESLNLVSTACLSPTHDTNWLVDSTESWCKRRAVYLALVQSISLADDSNKKTYNPDAIPDIMREALAISFDSHIGHNYLSDFQERFNYYHRTEDHISFGLKYFDLITNGGVIDKTLNVLLAGCVHPDTKVKIRFRKRTSKWKETETSISEIKKLLEEGYEIEVDSPDGYVPVNFFINKGMYEEYELCLYDTTIVKCNESHLFETNQGWISAKVLEQSNSYWEFITRDGLIIGKVTKTDRTIPIVDINVDHENHRYYTNGVSSHNTGVGKSLTMCDIATNMLMQGKNVLYITCEMSEEKIAERMDANLMNINISDIKDVLLPQFTSKLQDIRNKTKGDLYIKEYPTSSAHAGHFDALISELELKQAFKPDVVFVDYINICLSSRYKAGTNANSYTIVKAIAEELRGLACKHSFPLITATQTTRSGFGSSDIELTDTSESWGLPQTADLMLALISTDDLDQLNQIMVKQLKNRYSDPTVHRKFVVGIDRRKMRLYDIEESGQGNIIQVSKASEMSDSDSKFKSKPDKKKYAEFKF
jgi:KaiC/GvpD/RAD55 family RecA-like ATPase